MGTKQYDSATDLITFSRASGGTALSKISYSNDELVTNGTFDSDLSGWSASHGASTQEFDNGTLQVKYPQYNTYSVQYLTGLVVGTSYQVNFSVTNDTQGSGGASHVGIWETNSYGSYIERFTYTKGVVGSYTFTFTATSTVSQIRLTKGSNTGVTNFDNVSVKEVLFDQADGTLQVFNHGNNKPRIEYDATGAVKGLLIEEARTNLMTSSGDVAGTGWTSVMTKGAVTAGSPFGTYQTISPTNNASNLAGAMIYQLGKTLTSGATYITSSLVKYSAGSGWFIIRTYDTGTGGSRAWFDLQNGVVGTTQSSAVLDHGMIDYGDGWWLCWASSNATSTSGGFIVEVPTSNGGFSASTADVILIAGSQFEQGAFLTSYIPTTNATVTRARDIAQISTSAFGYNNDKGSLVVDVLTPVADQLMTLAYFNVSTFNNSRGLWKSNSGITAVGTDYVRVSHDGATTKFTIGQQTQAEYTKLGLSYGDNERGVRDGGTVLSGDSRYPNPTRLHLGGRDNGFQGQCWIKSIQYYPRRLTNTQLQELTT